MDVQIGDFNLHYEIIGDGEPILFIHGFPLSGEMWRPTAERLADRWKCIVPDLRGHGQSSATTEASMTRYADDLAALLDKLHEWRPAVIVGLSMGGYIAFEFFRRHRNRIRALVMADTQANADAPDAAARRETLAQTVLKDGSRAIADAMIPQLFSQTALQSARDQWHAAISQTSPVGVAAALRAMATRPDSTPTLAQIDCPTLIVVGQHDTITPPAVSEEMHRAIRGSRLEIILTAGHVPPIEQAGSFTGVLRQFIEELG